MERYRGLVDDWDAFVEALARPQPVTLRANRLRLRPEALRAHLEAQGFRLEPYAFCPEVMRVEAAPVPPAKTLEHWLGWFYLQEAAAAVPVLALDPQPGERVLDLSAAPGGKTTQAAERMGDRGLVAANDPDGARLRALLSNVYRLGVTCCAATRYDGRAFPAAPRFDRVLVDAPCSAEGNARRSARARAGRSDAERRRLAAVQVALLRAGLARVREGGVVVYSTCTFAPEENEAVVDAVLRAAEGAVALEPLPEGLPGVPGVTSWQGERFLPQLELARRIYPHHLDSGGMFVARLRRLGPLPWDPGPQPEPEALRPDPELRRQVVAWFAARYGVPEESFAGLHAYRQGSDVWLSRLEGVPAWPGLQAVGIRLLRGGGATWKPTSLGLMNFAQAARHNVADVDAEALRALLQGRRVAPPAGAALERGYVILRFAGHVLGCGVLDEHGLRSAIPRGRAEELFACLEAQSAAAAPERS